MFIQIKFDACHRQLLFNFSNRGQYLLAFMFLEVLFLIHLLSWKILFSCINLGTYWRTCHAQLICMGMPIHQVSAVWTPMILNAERSHWRPTQKFEWIIYLLFKNKRFACMSGSCYSRCGILWNDFTYLSIYLVLWSQILSKIFWRSLRMSIFAVQYK